MKVDFNQIMTGLDGNPYPEENKNLTLGIVCVRVLATPTEEDKNLLGEVALARWKLATRIYAGGEQELTPEEISLIRGRLTKIWAPFVAGQAYEMLE